MSAAKNLCAWTRAELLALPRRAWDDASPVYDSLLVFSSRRKHDSGWSCIAIVGCVKNQPIEVCTECSDDIEWKFPSAETFGGGKYSIGQMRMDCLFPAGIMHAWSHENRFRVGISLSSIEVQLARASE